MLPVVLALGSMVPAVADEPIPEAVLSFARTLTGTVEPNAVRATPVPGLYEVRVQGEFVYVTEDGRFFVHGDLYDARDRRNLTEASRQDGRLDIVEAIDPGTFIVFDSEKPEHTLTVFTDVDCPYCAKFHLEVPELNKLGVRVRYAAWPRTPPGTESYARSVSVWCAEDQHQAMTDAKAGREIEPATCENPVQAHFEAGQRVGVRGTPSIVTEDGELIGGYVPYRDLVQKLDRG
jgi:thiol:disulfide interchange protein DsbC